LPPGFSGSAPRAGASFVAHARAGIGPAGAIPLVPGWNLVSLPEQPASTDPAIVLASIAGSYRMAWAYDCAAAEHWKFYDPANPASSTLTAIDHKIGLWIEATAAATPSTAGTIPASTSIALCAGWNVIGYPLAQSQPLATALASIAGKYTRVYAYDAVVAAAPWAVYDVAVPAWANNLQTMAPGYGYYVNATENTTLVMAPPTPTPTPTPTLTPSPTPTITPTPSGPPPTVEIFWPLDGAEITTRTGVTGTASSPTLATWTLEYRLGDDPTWTRLASGSTSVEAGLLGSFDPTMLLNGIYELRLTAVDVSGQTAAKSVQVVVKRDLKVGNFTISFIDVDVPVAGLPIQVIRTYDSRDKRTGDFGVGWTLDIKSTRLQENGVTGEDWVGTRIGGLIPTYCVQQARQHIVTVTLPDGTVYEFQPTVSPQCQQLIPPQVVTVGFEPLPGANATLAPIGDNEGWIFDPFPGPVELVNFDTGFPLDFDQYQLATLDGRVLVIDQLDGLQSMTDPNGNSLTITAAGIVHSSGKSVAFTRDAANRITRITDPLGNALSYVYDAAGDLVSVTDQAGYTTQFTYNASHGLLDIIDPRGIRPARNEYDADGRLIAHVDADGNRIEYTHNLDGRQEVVTDRLGNVTVYAYDDAGNVLQVTDPLGGVTGYTYDGHGNKLTETDPLGRTTAYTYDGQDNLLSRTDSLGATTSYTYNGRGQALTTTDPLGRVTTNTYDANGNLLTTTDPQGAVTTNNYDAAGNLTGTTDPLGGVTAYTYDAAGRMTSQTDAAGHVTTYTYDANGNKLSETTTRTAVAAASDRPLRSSETSKVSPVAETITTQYVYDGLNRLVRTVDPYGAATVTEYNAIGKQAATVDKLGRRTTYDYDTRGNLARVTYPDGTSESYTYDAEGRKLTTTDRGGRTTSYTYDAAGRLIRTTYPDGAITRTEYDAAGRVARTYDERGNATSYTYDAAGRRTSVVNALGQTTTYAYDAAGNLTQTTDALDHTTRYEYDGLNRRVRTVYADGSASVTAYDSLGRKSAETDPAGRTTAFAYDSLGRLTQVTDALGNVTRYGYDELGNLTSQTDANGHTTHFAYDQLGRRTARTLPLGMSETTAYDAAGKVISLTDFGGQMTTYEYDAANRLTAQRFPDGTAETTTYTATGQRLTVTDARGVTTYAYDTRDRLTRRTDPDGRSIAYTYDAAGNRTSVTAPSGATTYGFDALNRLATATDPDVGVTAYTYDAAGNRASMAYPNGTVAEYTCDALNRLTNLLNRKAGGAVISSYAYTLGPAGNRTRVVEHSGRAVDYSYDAAYKLTEERINDPVTGLRTISYTYDPAGNRLTKTDGGVTTSYTYDANDRLLAEGGNAYTYDANGNTRTRTATGENVTYGYDFRNRLAQAQITAGASSSTVAYAYDADGIRVRKTVDGAVTNYLVDANRDFAQVLEERDGAGALVVSYVYGDDLISQKRGSAVSYYHYDGQMSTRQLSNGTQIVTDEYVYGAFGETLQRVGSTNNEYLYTGECNDLNTGFYYLRARFYDPSLGRFVTADRHPFDPFDPPTLHRYVYAKNRPTDLIDPSGQFWGFTLPSLMTALSIRISWTSATLLQGWTIGVQIGTFWRLGFLFREKALQQMADYPADSPQFEEAFKLYEIGTSLISRSAIQIEEISKALDYTLLVVGAANLANDVYTISRIVGKYPLGIEPISRRVLLIRFKPKAEPAPISAETVRDLGELIRDLLLTLEDWWISRGR
jgi:RHS repeat-associated protein